MTKRKKIILLCLAIGAIACLGATIPLLFIGEDSAHSSNTDTSSFEVSVSISDSSSANEESFHKESSPIQSDSGEEISSDSEEASKDSTDVNSDSISQTSDSTSEAEDSSSIESASPLELVGLGAHGLTVHSIQGERGAQFCFTVPQTGLYAISSQSILPNEEGIALTYTIGNVSSYVTHEKQTLSLKEGDILLLTAYVYDDSLFVGGSFTMDFSILRLLDLGENTLSLTDSCEVYFTPLTDGEYLFTASEGVRIFYFSTTTLRNEELTTPLSLKAGMEVRLVLQLENPNGEAQTVYISVQ